MTSSDTQQPPVYAATPELLEALQAALDDQALCDEHAHGLHDDNPAPNCRMSGCTTPTPSQTSTQTSTEPMKEACPDAA